MNRVRLSCWQTLVIAHQTVRAAVRQRLVGCLLVVALALALGARWLRDFNFGAAELDFLTDCGFGAMGFFGAALSISATARLFLEEIENRSVVTLLARPVGRAAFVLGKFLGVATLLGGFCAALGLGLGVMLEWRAAELLAAAPDATNLSGTIGPADLAAATVLQWLKLTVLAAFVMLVAGFARTQLFTVTLGVLLFATFHLHPLAHEAWNRGSWLGRTLGRGVAMALPNFHLFAFDRGVSGECLRITAYGAGYVVLIVGLAIFAFRHREL